MLDFGEAAWLAAAVATVVLATCAPRPAFAEPRFDIADPPAAYGPQGLVPAGVTSLEWCVEYEETALAMECGAVAATPGDWVPEIAPAALDGYWYRFRWRYAPIDTAWSEPSGFRLDSIPSDVTGDGWVGAPDFRAVIRDAGCDVKTGAGCPE